MIPRDKLLHLLAGAIIAAAAHPFGLPIAAAAVAVIAIGKELYDRMGHGTRDPLDALATIAGGALVLGGLAAFPLLTK